MKKTKFALLGLISVFLFTGCSVRDIGDSNLKDEYQLNEKFVYDDLEISVGSDYTIVHLYDEFSLDYGKPILRIPLNVKNVGSKADKLSLSDVKVYTPTGTEAESYYSSFDDSIYHSGELLPNASYITYFYAGYTTNGTYIVSFGFWSEKTKVKLNVNVSDDILYPKNEFGFNEKFTFRTFEITILENYTLVNHPNQFAEYASYKIVKLPMTIKNIGTSPEYLYGLKIFGPNGSEIKSQDLYFNDAVDSYINILPGSTLSGPLYFPFVTAGQYSLVFTYIHQMVTAKLNISSTK